MEDCIFCKIAKGEFNTEFLYSDNEVVAFNDVNPQAPYHVIIIPRSHFGSIKEMDDDRLIGRLFTAGNAVAKQLELDSYRFVINTGKEAGQSVFHVHLHLLGGREMKWPPG
jgi:histidine triad (HIT) family protein